MPHSMRQKKQSGLIAKPNLGRQINFNHPLARGMKGCWIFNERSGDQIWDYSNNGNQDHQAINNGATWIPGISGSALSFTTNDYIEHTEVRFRLEEEGTFSAWCTTTTTARQTIFCKDLAGYNDDVKLQIDSDGKAPGKMVFAFHRDSDNTIQWVADTIAIPTNTWIHYVGTFGPNGIFLYRDGVQVAYSAAIVYVRSYPLGQLRVAMENTALINPWEGQLDDMRIYDRQLDSHEVKELHDDPYGIFEPSYESTQGSSALISSMGLGNRLANGVPW